MRKNMTTINLSTDVKKQLDEAMLEELQKHPQKLISTLKSRFGFTYSEYIEKLIKNRKNAKK